MRTFKGRLAKVDRGKLGSIQVEIQVIVVLEVEGWAGGLVLGGDGEDFLGLGGDGFAWVQVKETLGHASGEGDLLQFEGEGHGGAEG